MRLKQILMVVITSSLILFVGCAIPIKLYKGEELPSERVATIVVNAKCCMSVQVDDMSVTEYRKVTILPGQHIISATHKEETTFGLPLTPELLESFLKLFPNVQDMGYVPDGLLAWFLKLLPKFQEGGNVPERTRHLMNFRLKFEAKAGATYQIVCIRYDRYPYGQTKPFGSAYLPVVFDKASGSLVGKLIIY